MSDLSEYELAIKRASRGKRSFKKVSSSKLKTAEDFHAFYKAIPVRDWCVGGLWDDAGRSCALGHLQTRVEDAHIATARLWDILLRGSGLTNAYASIAGLNDGLYGNTSLGKTPRTRILKALKKAMK